MMPINKAELLSAQNAFRSFCEDGLQDDHPFQKAWDRHTSHHGEIEDGMPLCSMIEAAILYGIQWANIERDNEFHDSSNNEVPGSYLAKCECHEWTAAIRHHVYQHKPACPNFVIEYELALMPLPLAKKQHNQLMRQLQEQPDRAQ